RAGRHAAGDRGAAARGGECDSRAAGHRGEARRCRLRRSLRHHACGARGAHPQRSRALRQADQGHRPRGGLTIVRGSFVAGPVAAATRYDPSTSADRRIFMRKHSWMLTVCLVAGLSAAGPARAQTPSPDAIAAAHELIVTMRAADFSKTIMPALMQTLKPATVKDRPQVERDYDAIVPLLLEGMNARVNEVIEEIAAAVYARNFTANELREAVAFYRGPTGQKFVQ